MPTRLTPNTLDTVGTPSTPSTPGEPSTRDDRGTLFIADGIAIPLAELDLSAVRSQGAGGQNVNKVSSAIHLRFDVRASSLPDPWKMRILARADQRLTRDGVIVIKAQTSRSQDQNRAEALARLQALIRAAIHVPRKRRPTKPTRASQKKRVEGKIIRGRIKALRRSTGD